MDSADQPAWQVEPRPGYQINSTAISASGERCILGTSNEFDSGQFGVYCYDGKGRALWNDPFGEDIYQGVFWVAISDDARYAAAGGATAKTGATRGFLQAYDAADGRRLLTERLPGRINEVEISADGALLVAATDDQLRLYRLHDDRYVLSDTFSLQGQYCISCGIAADGRRAVVGSYRDYSVSSGPEGFVQMLDIRDGKLVATVEPCTSLGKILRVAIVRDGSWWGASTHAGQCAAFTEDPVIPVASPAWIHQPAGRDLSVAYAFAICKTDDGRVVAACGANESGAGHGCVFAVDTVRDHNSPSGYRADQRWLNELEYDPNPGVNMDAAARYVTATDGQPYSTEQKRPPAGSDDSDSESPGNFYLFDSASGRRLWKFHTSLMNWPMAISTDGRAIFGASDNGNAYYWRV